MSISNTALLLTNPDFVNIKGSLVNFLKSQNQFKDIDYEGSNMSVVLSVLAYNTYQNAFLTNMVATEMFLDTAQMRSSIVSHAKELGYIPRSSRSAIATVGLKIEPNDDPGTIIIPKHTLFSTTIGNQSFTFMTDEAHTITVSNNEYKVDGINIYEGFLIQETYVVNSAQENQKFVISNKAVDTNSIEVFVSSGGDEERLTYTTSITGVDSRSPIFFIQQDPSERYELIFGDGVTGKALVHDTLVRVTYRITAGDAANGAYIFKPVAEIAGYSNITVTTSSTASGGAAEESDESIRRYAPLLNQTRGRAFTDDDYKVILKQAYPEIQAINVYGGEKVTPPQYGKVVISIDVAGADGIPESKKQQYFKALKSKNPTVIEPMFVDPKFFYLKIDSTVYFDYTQTGLTPKDIEAAVLDKIMSFNGAYLNQFDTTFRNSKFTNAIDSANDAINSNDTKVQLASPVNIVDLSKSSQTIKFENEIDSESADAVTSNLFRYANKVCKLTDSNGTLYISTSDEVSVNIVEIGTVDYEKGTVTLFPFNIDSIYGNQLKVYIKTRHKDLVASLNNIIAIDMNDVIVTPVAQRR